MGAKRGKNHTFFNMSNFFLITCQVDCPSHVVGEKISPGQKRGKSREEERVCVVGKTAKVTFLHMYE